MKEMYWEHIRNKEWGIKIPHSKEIMKFCAF